jgi:Kef-type K+ transport system membrane component KefB
MGGDTEQSLKPRPPLGLPSGSVRALLTLLIVAVVLVQVARGREVEPLWTETLMIALAHYFTSRRFIRLAPDAIRRLEAEGQVETESHPLYLPRHTIRAVLMLAFLGFAVYLYQQNQLFEPAALSLLGVVFAYLLGIIARGVLTWWTKGRKTGTVKWWEDLKAAVVFIVLVSTATAYLLDRSDQVPHQLRNTTLGLVLFYFGSR